MSRCRRKVGKNPLTLVMVRFNDITTESTPSFNDYKKRSLGPLFAFLERGKVCSNDFSRYPVHS